MIMENALKMAVVGPAKVMILSGQLPSEMLMRAPLCRQREEQGVKRWNEDGRLQMVKHTVQTLASQEWQLYILLYLTLTSVNKED